MTVHALPDYRPDCSECQCPMDGHFGDGGDAGCRAGGCQCMGYRYPWEPAAAVSGEAEKP